MAEAGGEAKLREAIRAGEHRDYKRAVLILEELISETDPPKEAFLYLGRALHALKYYSRAIVAFRDYSRLVPSSADAYLFAGRTYLSIGLPKKAAPLLMQASKLRPSDAQIQALLGLAYLKARRTREAVDALEAAVTTAPDNRRIFRAYLNSLFIRGIRLVRIDDPELGAQMLRFVLKNGMDLPLLRLELGRACRNLGMMQEAIEHYTKAVEYAPSDPYIRWYRASILMFMGMNDDALVEIEKLRSLGEDLPNQPWNSELIDRFMIRSFLEAGMWRRVVDACRSWIKTRGEDPALHAVYSEAMQNLGNFEAARNHLNQAVELEPGKIELWYAHILLAWKWEDWGTLKRAIGKVKKLGGDSDTIEKYSLLCDAHNNDEDRAVIARLQEGIRRFSLEPDIMYALGERYLKVGLIEEALGWFEKVTLINKAHEKARLGIIASYEAIADEGDRRGAARLEKAYKQYLALWPDNRKIRREWALFLIKTCDYTAAARELEKLLAWEPVNPSLRRVLAYTYRKTNRYRDAAVLLKGLLKEKPKNVELLMEFTGCIARAGSVQYAIKTLEKALKVFRKSADIPIALGLLYYRESRVERAFDMLREAAGRDSLDPRPYEWMASLSRKTGNANEAEYYDFEAKKRKNAKNS